MRTGDPEVSVQVFERSAVTFDLLWGHVFVTLWTTAPFHVLKGQSVYFSHVWSSRSYSSLQLKRDIIIIIITNGEKVWLHNIQTY